MDIQSIPLFAMLRGRMGYLSQRQQVIAQNVANSNTPNFTPKDLEAFKPPAASATAGPTLSLASVSGQTGGAGQIAFNTDSSSTDSPAEQVYRSIASPDGETKLDGNRVVLEEQMLKMSQTRSDYQAAVGIYQKAMGFLALAAKVPGR